MIERFQRAEIEIADSTRNLLNGRIISTVPGQIQELGEELSLIDIVFEGYGGVMCAESGGPTPGIGCAGLGIISAFNKLEGLDAYRVYRPDIVIYACWATWFAAGSPCPCARAMRIMYSL